MQLEDLQPRCAVRGVHPDGLVTVVSVQWFRSEALELTSLPHASPFSASTGGGGAAGIGINVLPWVSRLSDLRLRETGLPQNLWAELRFS